MLKKCYSKIKGPLSIAILDFERPDVSYALLQSIRRHVKIPNYEVIFYSNGGRQDYVGRFYTEGLVDKLILSTKNEGSSFSTIRMHEFVQTEYVFNLHCDTIFVRDFSIEEFNSMCDLLNTEEIGAIDFTFLTQFSERAYLMRTDFSCANPLHEGGGMGPYLGMGKDSETAAGEWLKQNKKRYHTWPKHLIGDIGKYSISEYPCGGKISRRCDTQQIVILQPFKEKHPGLFNINDAEWELILDGKWKNGSIPENGKKWSFFFYSKELDPIEL